MIHNTYQLFVVLCKSVYACIYTYVHIYIWICLFAFNQMSSPHFFVFDLLAYANKFIYAVIKWKKYNCCWKLLMLLTHG